MKNSSSETPMEKIDFLLKRLVDFSNENKFDFAFYKNFAEESGKAFNRYFTGIDNEADREKIISNLNEDFHFYIDNLSTNISSSNRNNGSTSRGTVYIAPSTPDNRINGYENNYKQLKELFLNKVQLLETKTSIVPVFVKQTKSGIMKAKDYISLIVNSYFDAQESLGNNPELIDLVKDLFQQTLLRVGKKQEQDNCMTTYEFNSRVYFALEAMKDCGYYDGWEITNNTEFMRIETIIKDIERPISRIEFKNIGDWIDELTSAPQQPEPENKHPNIITEIGFEFKNNFDNVTEKKVFDYFKNYLVDTNHITETNLNLFLNLAFDKKEVPNQKLSFEHLKTQRGIIQIFYNYYKIVAGKPYGKQPKYLYLLCDYFNGFDYDKIKTNFSKQ